MEQLQHPADREVAALAARQHGVVATWQLIPLGFSYREITGRAAVGWRHRLDRGVYRVAYASVSVPAIARAF